MCFTLFDIKTKLEKPRMRPVTFTTSDTARLVWKKRRLPAVDYNFLLYDNAGQLLKNITLPNASGMQNTNLSCKCGNL